MLPVRVEHDTLHLGPVAITFHRTLRIPDNGKTYPLPPSLGRFPVKRVEDYADRVPAAWREHGGVFIPMYQREALWLSFGGQHWRPNALKVAIGKVNAISGEAWRPELTADPQDYVVVPGQPWLDGINSGDGIIRQFVAMPLGMGYTVEAQVTGKEDVGGIQLLVVEPKAGRFPDEPPLPPVYRGRAAFDGAFDGALAGAVFSMAASCPAPALAAAGAEMGLAAGGRMTQKIYPDAHGIDTWDAGNTGRVFVHIVNSQMYREITGEEPPPTPVTARTYAQYGYPWFALYDEHKGDVAAPEVLQAVSSVSEVDAQKGFSPQQDDAPLPPLPVVGLPPLPPLPKGPVPDGTW